VLNKLEENNNFQSKFSIEKRKIDLMQYKGCFDDLNLKNLLNQHYLDINF
jgi:hypothetical protein